MSKIEITNKDLEIGSFYFKNIDSYTLREVAEKYKVSTKTAGTAITKFMNFRRMRSELIDWDPHELDGELNPNNDFRKLIKYEAI